MRLPVNATLPLVVFAILTGCAAQSDKIISAQETSSRNGPGADYPITIGKPYNIGDVNYIPADVLNSDQVGFAAQGSEGGDTISIAHKTLPLPSYAEVTALDSGKTILVRVERRGPMTNEQLIELSAGASAQLGISGKDKAPVRIRRVNPPENERALLRSGNRVPDRMDTPQSLLNVLKRKLDPHLVAPVITVPEPAPSPVSAATAPISTPTQSIVRKNKPAAKLPVVAPPAVTDNQANRAIKPVVETTPRQTFTEPGSAADARGGIIVQIAAFSDPKNAEKAVVKLGASKSMAGRFTRVFMGPYSSRAEAEAALVKAKQSGYKDARIQSTR